MEDLRRHEPGPRRFRPDSLLRLHRQAPHHICPRPRPNRQGGLPRRDPAAASSSFPPRSSSGCKPSATPAALSWRSAARPPPRATVRKTTVCGRRLLQFGDPDDGKQGKGRRRELRRPGEVPDQARRARRPDVAQPEAGALIATGNCTARTSISSRTPERSRCRPTSNFAALMARRCRGIRLPARSRRAMRQSDGDRGLRLRLGLGEYESTFVVVEPETGRVADRRKQTCKSGRMTKCRSRSTWQVAKARTNIIACLQPRRNCRRIGPSARLAWLDLQGASQIIRVKVNGKPVGERFCPPYSFDVGRALHPGSNRIVVERIGRFAPPNPSLPEFRRERRGRDGAMCAGRRSGRFRSTDREAENRREGETMNSRERVLTALASNGQARSRPLRDQLGRLHAVADAGLPAARRVRPSTPDEYFDFDTRSIDLNPTQQDDRFQPFFRRPVARQRQLRRMGLRKRARLAGALRRVQVPSAAIRLNRRRRAGFRLARRQRRRPLRRARRANRRVPPPRLRRDRRALHDDFRAGVAAARHGAAPHGLSGHAGDGPRHLPIASPSCASNRRGGWPPSASIFCGSATTSARKRAS